MSGSFFNYALLDQDVDLDRDDSSESGSLLSEPDEEQIAIDILFGILRDWTFIAAGLPGPWTDLAHNSLEKVLSDLQLPSGLARVHSGISDDEHQKVSVESTPRETMEPSNSIDGAGIASSSRQREGPRRASQRGSPWHEDAPSPPAESIRLLSPHKRRRILPAGSLEQMMLNDVDALPPSSENKEADAPASLRAPRYGLRDAQSRETYSPDHSAHPSRLSLTSRPGCASVLFLSQLVPRSFSARRRYQVLEILHYEAQYIPTCVVMTPGKDLKRYFGSLGDNFASLVSCSRKRPKKMPQVLGMSTASLGAGIPLEIVRHISEYLERRDIQSLLLTCKSLNHNLGPFFFEHVVLPFNCNTFEDVKSNVDMFRNWGKHVRKFGFAIETMADKLTSPPMKDTTTTADTFWGPAIPWAMQSYRLHPSLERNELVAGQKELMTEACSSLINVNELALVTDNGLGYIEAFDKSDRAKLCQEKVAVFGRRYAQSREEQVRTWLSVDAHAIARLEFPTNVVFARYLRALRSVPRPRQSYEDLVAYYMMTNPPGFLSTTNPDQINKNVKTIMFRAGMLSELTPKVWEDVKDLLVAARELAEHPIVGQFLNESVAIRELSSHDPTIPRFGRIANSSGYAQGGGTPTGRVFSHNTPANYVAPRAWQPFDVQRMLRSRAAGLHGHSDDIPGLNRDLMARIFSVSERSGPALIFGGHDLNAVTYDALNGDEETFSAELLKPGILTLAQKQWLAETGWVQQAFLTSYICSIINNKPNFGNVRAFTLTKISSGHLARLQDKEFWDALHGVEKVTIMVSAEWRDITGFGYDFRSESIAPSEAVTKFERVLTFLAENKGITRMKIGYVDGGEHAIGLFGRNQHLLPAPIVNGGRDTKFLSLPYVKHLTFVNCWAVPEVLKAFIANTSKHALQTLRFESTSLLLAGGRAMSFPSQWPANLPEQLFETPHTEVKPPFYLGFGVPQPGTTTFAGPEDHSPTTPYPRQTGLREAADNAEDRRVFHSTWTDIINYCDSHADQYSVSPFEDGKATSADEGRPADQQHRTRMVTRIEFDSCGYAKLPFQNFGQIFSNVPGPDLLSELCRRKNALDPYMMKSDDPFLGSIIPEILEPERSILTDAFGMTMGWSDVKKRLEPQEDGQPFGGSGRFSGVVERG